MKATVIYQLKGKNARIEVIFFEDEKKQDEPIIVVNTKRLHSFKERLIVQSEVVYSIETFKVLSETFNHALNENAYIKKQINPYSKFEKWKADLLIQKLKP